MAWLLAAVAGIPVVLVTSWALIGGYTFTYLPFLGVRVTVPFAVAPLIAGFLVSRWPSRGSRAWAFLIYAICTGASVLAILIVWWDIPSTTVDIFGDSRARVDFVSLLVGGLLALIYLLAAIVATVRFGAQVLAPDVSDSQPEPSRIGRPTAMIAGGVTVFLMLSGVAGVIRANHLDGDGIPLQPTADWIAARPESTMLYQGATSWEYLAVGQENRISRSSGAGSSVTGFTPDSAVSVQAWYEQRLAARGWQLVNTATGPYLSWVFKRRDREVFTLTYSGPEIRYPASGRQSPPQGPGDGTISTSYDIYPIGQPQI